jgi:hypothetical protein
MKLLFYRRTLPLLPDSMVYLAGGQSGYNYKQCFLRAAVEIAAI